MTALQVLRRSDCVEFCTDGAGYLAEAEDGKLGQLASKIMIFPEISCALCSRGPGLFLSAIHRRISGCFVDFDAMLNDLADIAKRTFADLQDFHNDENVEDFELIVGGWSESRSSFETYNVVSHDLWVDDGFPPWVPHVLPQFYPVPPAEEEDLKSLGLRGDDGSLRVASPVGMPLYMQAQRMRKIPLATSCLAGGFIQKTELRRDFALTAIVFRWADKIGEIVEPHHGEADAIRAAFARDNSSSVAEIDPVEGKATP